MQTARPRHPIFEHPQQQGAFLCNACGRAQVEGRAWCQADEIDLVGVEPLIAPDLERYKGHAGRQRQLASAKHIEAIDVLSRNRLIGTDVENIDPVGAVPKFLDGAGDDAARDHGFAKAHFVRDQKLSHGVLIAVQPVKHIIDCTTLKGFQRSKGSFGFKPVIRHG